MTRPLFGRTLAGRLPWLKVLAALAVILSSAPLAIAYLDPGYQIAHDRAVPYMRTAELVRTLLDTQIPPRWFPNFDGGYGSPYPSFYAMGFYYLAGLIHMIAGLAIEPAVELTAFLASLLAGLAMYLLISHIWDEYAGLLAGILYLYAPYRLVDAYVRGALSELMAFVWYPLIVLALVGVFQDARPRWHLLGAVSIAGLLYTHNISAMLFLPAALTVTLVLTIVSSVHHDQPWALMNVVLMWLGGPLLAAPLWLPVLLNRRFIQTEYFLQFDFRGDFIQWPDLLATADAHSFTLELGMIHLIAAGVSLAVLAFRRRKASRIALLATSLCLFFGYLFMTNYRSTWLWETLPFVEFAQFPWRMLGPASFFLTVLAVSGLSQVSSAPAKLAVAAVLGVAAVSLHHVIAEIPNRRASVGTAPAQVCEEVWGTQDYRPRWSQAEFWHGPDPPGPFARNDVLEPCPEALSATGQDELDIQIIERSTDEYRVVYASDRPGQLRINQFYYPGWSAWLDEAPLEIEPARPSGLMEFSLPAGHHTLHVAYTGTTAERAGTLTLILGLFLLLAPWRKVGWSRSQTE